MTLAEIDEAPSCAQQCLDETVLYSLPPRALYLGMGSSFFAALTAKAAGATFIQPEIAWEFYNYYTDGTISPGPVVLVSQSGETSETLWCADLFRQVVCVTANPDSALARHPHTQSVLDICSGEELGSSTKSYISTLTALYAGLGIGCTPAFTASPSGGGEEGPERSSIQREAGLPLFGVAEEGDLRATIRMLSAETDKNKERGFTLAKDIYACLTLAKRKGVYVLGSGPNVGTAMQAALLFTETSKYPVVALSTAQYDHGPKEAAAESIVIGMVTPGPSEARTKHVLKTVREAGAAVIEVREDSVPEYMSPFPLSLVMAYAAYRLADLQGVNHSFVVGQKVTTVELIPPMHA